MAAPMSYLLCGTPRTGSTLLCSLLSSTGVAGRPESYFREQDQGRWAEQFGVPVLGEGPSGYPQFMAGAARFGSTPNGVFAARIMWGTMHRLVEGLDPHQGERSDVQVITDTVGPLRFVHLQRDDVVGQAVSWARAEQTGFWQHGDAPSGETRFDLDQINELVDTINEHNAAWRTWFTDQGVEPVEMTYEAVVAAPRDAVSAVLEAIGAQMPDGWTPASPHRRQADAINADCSSAVKLDETKRSSPTAADKGKDRCARDQTSGEAVGSVSKRRLRAGCPSAYRSIVRPSRSRPTSPRVRPVSATAGVRSLLE